MTTVTRINPPIEMETPRGRADAHFLIDYSSDDNLVWVCFLRGSGECWSFKNPVVRKTWCETMGTGQQPTNTKKPVDSPSALGGLTWTEGMQVEDRTFAQAFQQAHEAAQAVQSQQGVMPDPYGRYMHLPKVDQK